MKRYIFLALRLAAASIFIVSGFIKLMQSPQNFLAVLDRFQILNGSQALFVAYTLPWMEFIFGVFVALGLWTRLGLSALWGLNTLFIGVLVSARVRGITIENCGCFGEALPFTASQILIVDIVLWILFAALFRFFLHTRSVSLDDFLFDRLG